MMNEDRLTVEVEKVTNLGGVVECEDVATAAAICVDEDDPERDLLLESNGA